MRARSLRSAFVAVTTFALLASVVALATSSAEAAPITVGNSGFESPVTGSYTANPSLGSWTYVNAGGSFDYVQLFDSSIPASPGVTDGTQYYGMYNTTSTTRLYQDTGVAWAPDTIYTLSLALGNRSGVIGATTNFGLSTNNTVAGILGAPVTVNTSTIAVQDWDTFTYSFTTGDIAPLGNIFIVATKEGQAGDARIQLDNVQLDATAIPVIPAPEPASLALILGGLAFAIRGRKRRA